MMTKVSYRCLVALVCAHFCSTLSEGAIFPCSKNDTQFGNRTLLAWMGGTASFKLCAESSVRVFGWINISHPNHRDGWYPQPVGLEERLDAHVEIYHHTATVTIKLNKLQPADFNEPFTVTLFAADENGTRINDTSTFFFVIEETDPSLGDGSLILSTQQPMPAVTSIRTELSTVSLQANTTFTSTVSPKQEITQCWPHKTSQCPENWYQVDNETCLLVTRMSNNESASDVCNDHGSELVWRQNMKKLRSCLIKILGESKGASDNAVVRLDRMNYVNVQNGSEATGNGTYSVVCTSRTIKRPTISLFTLQIYTETGWSLVDNSTDYVTVKTPYADLALTCEAQGVPKPLVIVTDESGDQIRTRIPFRIDDCRQAGVYTCTASNALGRSQAHRRIRILSSLKVKFTANNNNRRAEIRSGDTVELRCYVDGCPDRVTISSKARPVTETVNYTIPLVHEITGVNCSHMGTYTCLAKSLTDQNVQETADLEVKGCPVSLCENDDASREMSPILGENVTISICVMSSEGLTFSANDTKIVVKFTRNPITRVYWTVNITMHDIEVEDYRTHTVRIANSDGSLDVHFTLTDKDTSTSTFEFESNTLLIALPPICFILIVFIIAGIVWYRVKGAHTARLRAEETDASDAGWEDTKGGFYENISLEMVPNEEYEEAAGIPYESIIQNTDDMEDLSHAEYVEIDDVQHETPVKGIDRKKPTSHVHSSEAEYANTITHV